jgi:hypothetical protein
MEVPEDQRRELDSRLGDTVEELRHSTLDQSRADQSRAERSRLTPIPGQMHVSISKDQSFLSQSKDLTSSFGKESEKR